MSRQPNVIPSIKLTLRLPQPEWTAVSTHVYSDLEQRIPPGSYQEFFVARIREFFTSKTLDLAPFAGTPPGAFTVRGSREAIEAFTKALNGEIPI